MKIALTIRVSVTDVKVYNCFDQRLYGSKILAQCKLEKQRGCRGKQCTSKND